MAIFSTASALLLAGYMLIGGLVLLRLASGAIPMASMLASKTGSGTDPERVQLLVATFIAIGGYVLSTVTANDGKAPHLPAVPDALLIVLGGSHALYLSGKLSRGNKG